MNFPWHKFFFIQSESVQKLSTAGKTFTHYFPQNHASEWPEYPFKVRGEKSYSSQHQSTFSISRGADPNPHPHHFKRHELQKVLRARCTKIQDVCRVSNMKVEQMFVIKTKRWNKSQPGSKPWGVKRNKTIWAGRWCSGNIILGFQAERVQLRTKCIRLK